MQRLVPRLALPPKQARIQLALLTIGAYAAVDADDGAESEKTRLSALLLDWDIRPPPHTVDAPGGVINLKAQAGLVTRHGMLRVYLDYEPADGDVAYPAHGTHARARGAWVLARRRAALLRATHSIFDRMRHAS